MAKPQDVLKSLSQIGHRIGENIEKTCQFGLTDPEGPKDRDLDPGLKLVWSISTKARAHATDLQRHLVDVVLLPDADRRLLQDGLRV